MTTCIPCLGYPSLPCPVHSKRPTTIPTDAERILLVSNTSLGYCSLFLNGKRERMFVLDREDDNTINVSKTVKKLAELADVTLITGVDPRVLMPDPDAAMPDKRWYESLAEASERQDELNEAARLKKEAEQAIAKAEQLDAPR
ncbi:hypothetical protein EFK50_01150 [Nocardioides marmoriginsengisoli]|uniref:Uncharacterized protein n=1 Tax=Nocardioides marmoriginsengisoli TaxID=661483 RepID=A0A3N0CTI5_9ACTN|nr:hypothetical protein [Nocardioides marmoriginsengisoli]RNL66263.1 hypothetical protein EFK50_01150 [Nocardioides marmoriginsengisoli]